MVGSWRRVRAATGSPVKACQAEVSARCAGVASQRHHRKRRSQRGTDDPANILHVCLWCHEWIHQHPTDSYELGLLVHSWDDPGKVPVRL